MGWANKRHLEFKRPAPVESGHGTIQFELDLMTSFLKTNGHQDFPLTKNYFFCLELNQTYEGVGDINSLQEKHSRYSAGEIRRPTGTETSGRNLPRSNSLHRIRSDETDRERPRWNNYSAVEVVHFPALDLVRLGEYKVGIQ
jgi:hypothetical protein